MDDTPMPPLRLDDLDRRRIDAALRGGTSRRDALRLLAAMGLGATAGASLLALPSDARAQAPRKGGRVRAAGISMSAADTLDPAKGSHSTDYTRHYLFYSGLTQLDGTLTPQPALAEEIRHEKAQVWTFTLRKGARFHDGSPLTPADVVYSLTRHRNPATASKVKTVAEQFAEVKASGPNQVQVRLATPNADLPVILAASHFLIVKDGAADFATANGTGPFTCKEFKPGVRTLAARFEGYWKPGRPYLDEVELIGIPDEPARVNALLAGDVQIAIAINARSTSRVKSSPGFAILETKSGLYTDLILRQDQAPGKNPDFVLAMKHLIDREQVKSAIFRGFAVAANDQPLPPTHRYFNASLPQRAFNLDKAKFHLQKSGFAGQKFPIVASAAAEGSIDMAVLLQQSAAKIGLTLQVNRVPGDGYWSNHWMKHPLGFGNVNPRPSADLLFTQFFKSDAPWNVSGWKNDQFDQLLLAARAEADEAKRKALYGDMQVIVHEKCGVGIPVFMSYVDGFTAKLKGLTSIPAGGFMGYMFAEHVWLDA
ncbi:MAG: ABC transporter substrate-binding protein [Betaproteobacteria bacterium]|nr:ABC transporter substrate-binding protein [Betaproteobacteria bacterium]